MSCVRVRVVREEATEEKEEKAAGAELKTKTPHNIHNDVGKNNTPVRFSPKHPALIALCRGSQRKPNHSIVTSCTHRCEAAVAAAVTDDAEEQIATKKRKLPNTPPRLASRAI